MKLIDDVEHAWKMFSVQANALNATIIGAYMTLPDRFKDAIPQGVVFGIAITLLVVGIVGRLVKQDSISQKASGEVPK